MTMHIASVAARRAVERVPYFALSADEALCRLGTSRGGLPADEAGRRLARFGPNALVEERGTPLWRKFAANLTNFFAVLLWIAAALSFVTGAVETGAAIVAVILINAVFA